MQGLVRIYVYVPDDVSSPLFPKGGVMGQRASVSVDEVGGCPHSSFLVRKVAGIARFVQGGFAVSLKCRTFAAHAF